MEGRMDLGKEGWTDNTAPLENQDISGLRPPVQPPRTPFSLATGEISHWKSISSAPQIKTIRPARFGPPGPGTMGSGTRIPPGPWYPAAAAPMQPKLPEPREVRCGGGETPGCGEMRRPASSVRGAGWETISKGEKKKRERC